MKRKIPHGTKEWAEKNYNFQTGCENGCLYCYANAMRAKYAKISYQDWLNPVKREKDLKKKKLFGDKTIMFPSSHDITELNLTESLTSIEKILAQNNNILIVSKPRLNCIKEICEKFSVFKDRITFRFSIGSCNNDVLKFWEPYAPSLEERLDCLKFAYANNYQTSISVEPMLDDKIHELVSIVEPFVTDTIWLGKVNGLIGKTGRGLLEFNGHTSDEIINAAKELEELQNNVNIINIYNDFKDNTKIRFKDSITKVINKHFDTD